MFGSSRSPLGIDLGPERVSAVSISARGGAFAVRETITLDVPSCDAATLDLKIAETARAATAGLRTRERRCILAAPSADVVCRTFRVPPGAAPREAMRAAELEAEALVDWPPGERIVALDPLSAPGELLLSVARRRSVERLTGIARAAGLRPIAVDVASCAWRRIAAGADAVLDASSAVATLAVFGAGAPLVHTYPPRLVDERLAAGVRAALGEARRDGVCDVARLTILSTEFRFESLAGLLQDDGYGVVPLDVSGTTSPPWALAYALATWPGSKAA